MSNINSVDIAFVCDTTSSMGSFITTARQHMIRMISELQKSSDIDLQVGIVEYRDHIPQERTFVARSYPFTSDFNKVQSIISNLTPQGGGDGPESNLDGLILAVNELRWRKHSRRIMVMIGDAPPHGVGCNGDAFPKGCPCGETLESTSSKIEANNTILYSIGLTHFCNDSFAKLSNLTGGEYFSATNSSDAPIKSIEKILKDEFSNLHLDQLLLDRISEDPDISFEDLALALSTNTNAISQSWQRLSSRKLVNCQLAPLLVS